MPFKLYYLLDKLDILSTWPKILCLITLWIIVWVMGHLNRVLLSSVGNKADNASYCLIFLCCWIYDLMLSCWGMMSLCNDLHQLLLWWFFFIVGKLQMFGLILFSLPSAIKLIYNASYCLIFLCCWIYDLMLSCWGIMSLFNYLHQLVRSTDNVLCKIGFRKYYTYIIPLSLLCFVSTSS